MRSRYGQKLGIRKGLYFDALADPEVAEDLTQRPSQTNIR